MKIQKDFKGRFVSGEFVKLNGEVRPFHGRIVYNDRTDDEQLVTYWDRTKKSYRSFYADTLQKIGNKALQYVHVS